MKIVPSIKEGVSFVEKFFFNLKKQTKWCMSSGKKYYTQFKVTDRRINGLIIFFVDYRILFAVCVCSNPLVIIEILLEK